MVVQIVRFQSELPEAKVREKYEARASRYRALPGLVQKYYLRYATGEYGAVYVWESDEALQSFLQSDLKRSIGDAYRVVGEKTMEKADVVMTLRPVSKSAEKQ